MAVRAFAVASSFRAKFPVEAKLDQRVEVFGALEMDAAAAPAVAATRPAARNEFLAAEGHAAVPAVAALDVDFGFVNKHNGHPFSAYDMRWSFRSAALQGGTLAHQDARLKAGATHAKT